MKENTVSDEPATIKKKVRTVHNPSFDHQNSAAARVLRITEEDGLTRIDFVVYSKTFWWVSIMPDSFIRPVNTDTKMPLVKVVNIPTAPAKHFFHHRDTALYYKLYFPALPKDVKAIDIIEKEAARPNNYFNFYGVSLERIASEIIKVNQN